MDAKNERADLFEAVCNLTYLIERTKDPAEIAQRIDQLNKLKAKLIALWRVKKATARSRRSTKRLQSSNPETRSGAAEGGNLTAGADTGATVARCPERQRTLCAI